MRGLLPQAMVEPVLDKAGVAVDTRISEITKVQRAAIVNALKRFDLTVTGLRPIEEAIITDGGVSLKEIDPKTMGSKLIDGLYFAGEIIDCAAYTGGYNLQIAFSTAHSAAAAVRSVRPSASVRTTPSVHRRARSYMSSRRAGPFSRRRRWCICCPRSCLSRATLRQRRFTCLPRSSGEAALCWDCCPPSPIIAA